MFRSAQDFVLIFFVNSDWFRLETMDDSFQPTIDLLLNVAVFAWFGAVCPWASFVNNDVVPIYRLIPIGILVLLLRRPPIVLGMHKWIRQIEEWRQALFVGFFGPIGVSAIFYLYTARELLERITVNGAQRADAARLEEVLTIVVWFMTICSIIVHGLSIPLGKVGWYLPRTLSSLGSRTMSRSSDPDEPERSFRIGQQPINASSIEVGPTPERPRQIFRIGGTVIRNPRARSKSAKGSRSASRDGTSSGVQTPSRRIERHEHTSPRDEPTDRRRADVAAGHESHEQAVAAARLGHLPGQEDEQGSEDDQDGSRPGTSYAPEAPASPSATHRSITWAALAGTGVAEKSSYTRGRADARGSRSKKARGPVDKRDIRILGARPMGRSSVSERGSVIQPGADDDESGGVGGSGLRRQLDSSDADDGPGVAGAKFNEDDAAKS